MDIDEKRELLEVLMEKESRRRFNKAEFYEFYPWQLEHFEKGKTCPQRLLMTGNRCGKTYIGAYEASLHATGRYPDWWKGLRFERAVKIIVSGKTTATTRDILQSELLGPVGMPDLEGSGTIPKDAIHDTLNFQGVPGAYQVIYVKHATGGISEVMFKSYEQGQKVLVGLACDYFWVDEECPDDFYRQLVVRTLDRAGSGSLTFTPETGPTRLVTEFMNDIKPGQALTTASWEDCPHLDEDAIKQLEALYTKAELEMRRDGRPMMGEGLVYPIPEDDVTYDPDEVVFERNWPYLATIDLGYTDPTVWGAFRLDPKADCIYWYDSYGQRREDPIYHAAAIKAHDLGDTIPIVFPHDGNKIKDTKSGETWAEMYRRHGLNCLFECFSNPPPPGKEKGGNSIEVGVSELLQRMKTGRFKVHPNIHPFFEEMRTYHRKNGKIADKQEDHYLDVARMAVQSMGRFGEVIDASKMSGYRAYTNQPIPIETRHYL
jgi:phage terminase large subunit-like protein